MTDKIALTGNPVDVYVAVREAAGIPLEPEEAMHLARLREYCEEPVTIPARAVRGK